MIHRLLLLGLLLAGCAADAPAPDAEAPGSANAEPDSYERPDDDTALADTIFIEGEPVPVALERFDHPELPFTTAFPEGDFRKTVERTGDAVSVRFSANFGGTPSPHVYATFLFPEAPDFAALREAVEDTLAARGWRLTDQDRPEAALACPWAEAGYTYEDPTADELTTGYACLARHAGRPFALLTHLPVVYTEGLGPRLDLLLERFRWRDDGTPLREPNASWEDAGDS